MAQWDFNDGIIPFLISVAAYGLLFSSPWLWVKWKEARQKITWCQEYHVRIGTPNEEVEQYTAQEEYLGLIAPVLRQGFEPVGDYVLSAEHSILEHKPSAPLSSPDTLGQVKKSVQLRFDVSRIFEHKGYGCIAVVISMHDKNESTVNVQVISSGSGWSYMSDRQEEQNYHFGMRERDIISHHGKVSFNTLLEEHLRCRAEIARAGNFIWGKALTMEDVLQREERYAQDVRDFGRRHSPFSLWLWERRAKRQGNGDWLGELTGKVSLPKGSDS